MAGLLYFIPGKQAVNSGDIEKVGLDKVFRGCSFGFRQTSAHASGSSGCIVVPDPCSPLGVKPKTGYYVKTQIWEKAPKADYWIGYEKDRPVKPDDLLRKEFIAGHTVKLLDGNEWTIPTARSFPMGSKLPKALLLGNDGELISEALPKFASISQKADLVWKNFVAQQIAKEEGGESEEEGISFVEAWKIATEAIGLDHVIGENEISVLRLFSTENVSEMLDALVDMPTVIAESMARMEANKKKDSTVPPDGSSTKIGEPESSPDTSQPLPILNSPDMINEE